MFIFVMLVFVEMFLLTAETAETRIPFSKRPRHIYLHHVPVILPMTAEGLAAGDLGLGLREGCSRNKVGAGIISSPKVTK